MNQQLKYNLGEDQDFKFSVGDVVDVVKVVHDDDECRLGQRGVVVFVDMFDHELTYKVAFLDCHDWFNANSLRGVEGKENVVKIKTIPKRTDSWEAFDERVNGFMKDYDVVNVDYKTLEEVIAVVTYKERCKTKLTAGN